MKARLVPVFFPKDKTPRFDLQTARLKDALSAVADLLPPVPLGSPLPDADAVIFPEILGEAYRSEAAFRAIDMPLLIVTSEFGTFSMWDWEIMNYLAGKGIPTLAPYNMEQARAYCRMVALRRRLRRSRLLAFQNNPGEGFQPEIFKSFYWWEDESVRGIKDKFGLTIERRSLEALGKKAATYTDADALSEWRKWDYPIAGEFSQQMAINAVKLYFALRDEIDGDDIIGMGTNCLNESRFCNTTPCLAWDRLLEEKGILWACEGDTVSLTTMCLVHHSLQKPLMMTNIYPFLMGDAATKHEKIPGFPEFLERPENHILMAHCGYFGLVPRRFSDKWSVREKCLAIVDPEAHAFDARLPVGPYTLTKLDATLGKMMSVAANLKGYVQYDKSSDCRNGGVIEVTDGRLFMEKIYSHHVVMVQGDIAESLRALAKVMGLEVERFCDARYIVRSGSSGSPNEV